jgi:hypothetical protein
MAPARADIIKINRCAHPVQPRKRIGMHALFSTFLAPAAARKPEREPKPRQVEKFIARALCAATKHFYTRRESMEREECETENDAARIRESKKYTNAGCIMFTACSFKSIVYLCQWDAMI